MLRSFFPKKEPLEICKLLQELDLQAVREETTIEIVTEFQLAKDKAQLFQALCRRMSQAKHWQSRLRYAYVLYRLTVDLKLYELTAQHRVDGFLNNLENLRGRMPTALRSYSSSSALERRINQHIVEPFYNYCLRLAFNSELREMPPGCFATTLQMFKLINLINMLFELREPCRFMLATFVNVFIVEQLVQTLYAQITFLFGKLRAALEFRVAESENECGSSLAELEVLLAEGRSTYKRIIQFHMLFCSFSRSVDVQLPEKPQFDRAKLRQLRTNERLYQLESRKSMRSRGTIPGKSTKNFISKFNSRTVYEQDASNIYDQSRIQEDTRQRPNQRRWVEDEEDVDDVNQHPAKKAPSYEEQQENQ